MGRKEERKEGKGECEGGGAKRRRDGRGEELFKGVGKEGITRGFEIVWWGEAVSIREVGMAGVGVGVARRGRSHARHTLVRASPCLPVTINLTPPHYCIRYRGIVVLI